VRSIGPIKSHWLILLVIILVGGLLRGLYLAEAAEKPDFTEPLADAAFHDYWARALVSGDWSPPENAPHPYINSVPFVRPPGYPYFLALSYAITGQSYLGARIVALVLGLVNCWLGYLVGRTIFNRAVGLVLAGMMAVYWSLIYIEVELHDPVLMITASLLFFLAMAGWHRRPSLWRLAVAGLLLGAMILIRPNVAVFVPLVLGWLWWRQPRRWQPLVVITATMVLAVLPATVRNLVVAGEFVAVSANGAVNLYIGNNEDADGVTTRIPDIQELTGESGWSCFSFDQIVQGVSEREGRPLSYSEVDRYFLKRGLDEITGDPGRFLGLTARRAALFWGPAAVSNNKAVGIEKAESAVLRWIPDFPVVLALALLGGALLWQARRRSVATAGEAAETPADGPLVVLVLLYIGAVFASYLPFLIADRFRIPLLPYVMLFGAYALTRIFAAARARSWGMTGRYVVAGAILIWLCGLSPVAYESDRAWWHTDQAVALAATGDMRGAEREYRAALQENAGFVDAHVGLANLLAASGRYPEAIRHFQAVVRHRPDHMEARTGLAAALTLTGKPEMAVSQLREVLRRSSGSAAAYFELGRALGLLEEWDEAERALLESLRLAPGQPLAQINLGVVLAGKGEHREAADAFREVVLIDPSNASAYFELGKSLCAIDSLAAGDQAFDRAVTLSTQRAEASSQVANVHFQARRYDDAARWYRRTIEEDPRRAQAHANLALCLANLGRKEEAVEKLREAIRLDPQNQPYRQTLARMESELRSKQ
jgi:tetratricopeptide (TPR) repeat protein